MDLIDTHQHLIWRDRLAYSWTHGIDALSGRDFTPDDYRAETEGAGIIGTIFMEVGVDDTDYQDETRHVAGLVGAGGLLGQIASCRPEDPDGFDAWLDECLGLGVNGFRRIQHVVPDEMSQGETFRENLRKIGAQGLPFDLTLRADQLRHGADLVRSCPDQVLVLDHCGNPDVAGGGFDSWAADIRALAAFPNLYVKLSGITPHCAPGTASRDTLAPYVDHLLRHFGPDRMLWGSDWPVVDLGGGLALWLELTHTLLADLSADERAKIGHANARRVYGV